MKKIVFSFEYHCFPIWIYDEEGIIIDNDLPAELEKDIELINKLEDLQNTYDSLFVDTSLVFEYKGFDNDDEKDLFIKNVHETVTIISNCLRGKYIFEDTSSIDSL